MDFDSFENHVYESSVVMWGFENHDNNDAFESMFFGLSRLAHCTSNYLRKESTRYIPRPLSYELLHEKQRVLSHEKTFWGRRLGPIGIIKNCVTTI